ncbi:chorismate mutase [Candidatus Phycosocius spiralis]|uniref:chorismate mutase n=1 Tax=Candidatus Phycosocius spiralis TaxID=2815099 RepID=A0ABQ4PWC6_9PROT|nr:chorismate mutase [Candidatus Phycosocius spiralis]GIU67364.1 chorismate mutase [Candidatus Phycosocius spiralis]
MTDLASSPRHSAQTCQTMADVRFEIDRIDRQLVALLAERQSFMDAAARIKGNRNLIRDEARIADVIAKVEISAQAAGLSMAIAEPVWRTLMDRCIAYEFRAFDKNQVPADPTGN